MGCTHALSPLPAHQCVEGLLSIQGPLPHPSLYKVSSAYEGCLVPIDMYLHVQLLLAHPLVSLLCSLVPRLSVSLGLHQPQVVQ